MPYAYDIAVGGLRGANAMLVATDGFISSTVSYEEVEPTTGAGSGSSTWRRRGHGHPLHLRYVPGELQPVDRPTPNSEEILEDDLPLSAAFAVAEELADVPHKDLLFGLAWLMRKRDR